MMSQTAPVIEPNHEHVETMPNGIKDNAFIAVYNDGDITELLFKTAPFASGFLPLEPDDAKPTPMAIPKRRLAGHFNTGTTPPPQAFEGVRTLGSSKPAQVPAKSAIKAATQPTKAAEADERRPSFIEVSTPAVHHKEQHQQQQHQHRRHSSESHLPMSWWPEEGLYSEHVWVEKNQTSADEEEDMLEDCLWTDAFYD